MALVTGEKGISRDIVTEDKTAAAVGSGLLHVYSTPSLVALMENAACSCISDELEAGKGTVGTLMNIKHLSATPVGMEVYAQAELTEIDGRRLVFAIEAFDASGKIGEAVHERFIITNEKFMTKAQAKLVQ